MNENDMLNNYLRSVVVCLARTFLFLSCASPSLSVISVALMALGKSCLLAKTSKQASLNSSSCS